MIRIALLLTLLYSATFAMLNVDSLFSDEEVLWLKENPVITYSIDTAWPPYDFLDSKNEHAGFSKEWLDLVQAQTGLTFKAQTDLSWNQAIDSLKNRMNKSGNWLNTVGASNNNYWQASFKDRLNELPPISEDINQCNIANNHKTFGELMDIWA